MKKEKQYIEEIIEYYSELRKSNKEIYFHEFDKEEKIKNSIRKYIQLILTFILVFTTGYSLFFATGQIIGGASLLTMYIVSMTLIIFLSIIEITINFISKKQSIVTNINTYNEIIAILWALKIGFKKELNDIKIKNQIRNIFIGHKAHIEILKNILLNLKMNALKNEINKRRIRTRNAGLSKKK